jgi:hypothetical protein
MSEIRELTDAEVKEVCGGVLFTFPNITTNIAPVTQVAIATGGIGLGSGINGNAVATNLANVANFSLI